MGKRSITKRLPLTKSKNKKYPKLQKKRGRKPKKPPNEDDDSYILPSKTEETVDFDALDLEDETIESQLNSPIIDLTDDESKVKNIKKIRTFRTMKKASKRRNDIPATVKKMRKKRTTKKKGENMNSFAELNHCYNKLSDLISEYNFSDIADVILKLNNDIEKDISDSTEMTLFREFKKINTIIKKKEDITMMCLSILASKNNNTEISIDNNKDNNDSKKAKEEKPIIEIKNEKKETKPKLFMNSLKEMKSSKYIFDFHYYNSKNGVYIYAPKVNDRIQSVTMICRRNPLGCKAKCVIYRNSDDVTMKGTHNHPGINFNYFCKLHPEFKNKDWEHVQVIKENGEEIIIKQC